MDRDADNIDKLSASNKQLALQIEDFKNQTHSLQTRVCIQKANTEEEIMTGLGVGNGQSPRANGSTSIDLQHQHFDRFLQKVYFEFLKSIKSVTLLPCNREMFPYIRPTDYFHWYFAW